MNDTLRPDWNPRSETVLRDQLAAYDRMRERCPVAYSDFLGWALFRHEDLLRVLNEPGTFSNAVSSHVSVPKGMDPPEHTEYRGLIEPYFRLERMEAFDPQCREIAANLVQSLPGRDEVELISEFAQPFALRVQCAFLGWPPDMHEVCPMTRYAKAATGADGKRVIAGVLAVLREQPGTPEALGWISVCARSGVCVPACPDEVDPRMMMRLARMTASGGRGHAKQMELSDDPDYFNRVRAFAKLNLSDEELKDWT